MRRSGKGVSSDSTGLVTSARRPMIRSIGSVDAAFEATRAAPPPTWLGHTSAELAARATYNVQRLSLARSRIEGTGLFATELIRMDDVVGESTYLFLDIIVLEISLFTPRCFMLVACRGVHRGAR